MPRPSRPRHAAAAVPMAQARTSRSSSARLVLVLPAPAPAKTAIAKNQAPDKKTKTVATTHKKAKAAAPRLPAAAAREPLVPNVEAARPPPRFACGADVEVRSRLTQVSGRWLVIYARAKVVSASPGFTDSWYLVQYPAAKNVPSRVARVPASDIREPRRAPPPPAPAAAPDGAARPAKSKRPLPEDQSEHRADGRKKAKRTGRGIPMDALRRFMEEHEEEEARKKEREADAEVAPKLQAEKTTTENAMFFDSLMFWFLFS